MKKLPRPRRSRVLLAALLAATAASAALTPTEWQHRQSVTIAAPGPANLALPAATFDVAQANLADLRLLDASGQEVPFLLDRDLSVRGFERAHAFAPKSFRSVPGGETTQLLVESGTGARLDAIVLETSLPYFLKAAHVDVSKDGTEWQSLGAAVPVFRQFGAEQLVLPLGRREAAFIRVTLDDVRSRPMAFSGAKLIPAPTRADPPPLADLGARITRRDEFAGETVLTVTLDGRHVLLAGLTLDTKDPLFMRQVTVGVRDVRGELSSERVVGSGTVYRIAFEGQPVREALELPLAFTPVTRELLVHIHNGDSPPLTLAGVQAKQHPVNLRFMATAAGTYTLLSGNPQATAPHYDLAAFAGEMRAAGATAIVPGNLEVMPDYHPRESLGTPPLPDVPLTGAPLDASNWATRKAVSVARAGVQELELDPEVLARSRPDLADLRLLRNGNQIPYVLEQPGLARSLTLAPVAAPDPKRPTVSIWQVRVPHAGLPASRLVLTSTTPLFQREFRIIEKRKTSDGRTVDAALASGPWSRTPDPGVLETRTFDLWERMQTDTLWIETDNGDNPAITLGPVQAIYPVARLVFKVADGDGLTLAYGNTAANAPRYDLSLVAVKLLTSSRSVAQLAAGEPNPEAKTNFLAGLNSGWVFWGALALVVVVLLVVVAKLLPKPPPA